jgi:hypothetical protein
MRLLAQLARAAPRGLAVDIGISAVECRDLAETLGDAERWAIVAAMLMDGPDPLPRRDKLDIADAGAANRTKLEVPRTHRLQVRRNESNPPALDAELDQGVGQLCEWRLLERPNGAAH